MKRDGTIGTAGKGALIQKNLSATLGVTQDQYLFVPKCIAAIEGNGSRPSHRGGGGINDGKKMFTLNSVEVHGVAVKRRNDSL